MSKYDFVGKPGGGIDSGYLPELPDWPQPWPAGPVRLQVGDRAFGLMHISEKHDAAIAALGFESIEEFVEVIARYYDEILADMRSGNLVLVKSSGMTKLAALVLDRSGNAPFYTLKTAFPNSSFRRNPTRYRRLA